MNPPPHTKKHETYTQGDMADHSDDEGTRGGERAHDQASVTMNIFDWRSASKEEVAAFVEQRKEDYKDEHLYDFAL